MRSRLKKFLSNDSMSIALLSMFLVCIASQSITGWFAYNQELRQAHNRSIDYVAYLCTGNFLDGAFSNWQAAILQLAVLITFGSVLRQKGAAHSRKSAAQANENHRTLRWNIHSKLGSKRWLYANSLSVAFFTGFAIMFVLHIVFGSIKHNEDQALRHLPAISMSSYFISSGFWFSVFQTWEAEFSAIGIYIVLSIFLRQEHSSESKPTGASDQETGDTNE
ncbi:MAG: DUF6766 family protein [Chloroflexota bacterium]